MAALAVTLRRLPALTRLLIAGNEIGDQGVASLFANLSKDDFKALERLWLRSNEITDAGMTTLVAALDAGRLPMLLLDQLCARNIVAFFFAHNQASAPAVQAVVDALVKRSQ